MGTLVPREGHDSLAGPTGSARSLPRRARRSRTPLRDSRCLLLRHRAPARPGGAARPDGPCRRVPGAARAAADHGRRAPRTGSPADGRRTRADRRVLDAGTAIGKRDRAILLVGYASAMRPGEISALNIDDVLRKPTGVLLAIRRSKTDHEARGQLVGIARGENALTDPIRALDDWLKVRPTGQGALYHPSLLPEPPHGRTDRTPRDQPHGPGACGCCRLRRHPRVRPLPSRRPCDDRGGQRRLDRPHRRSDTSS